jgi:hypothetical protein
MRWFFLKSIPRLESNINIVVPFTPLESLAIDGRDVEKENVHSLLRAELKSRPF